MLNSTIHQDEEEIGTSTHRRYVSFCTDCQHFHYQWHAISADCAAKSTNCASYLQRAPGAICRKLHAATLFYRFCSIMPPIAPDAYRLHARLTTQHAHTGSSLKTRAVPEPCPPNMDNICSYSTRIGVFLWHKRTGLRVLPRKHVLLFNR